MWAWTLLQPLGTGVCAGINRDGGAESLAEKLGARRGSCSVHYTEAGILFGPKQGWQCLTLCWPFPCRHSSPHEALVQKELLYQHTLVLLLHGSRVFGAALSLLCLFGTTEAGAGDIPRQLSRENTIFPHFQRWMRLSLPSSSSLTHRPGWFLAVFIRLQRGFFVFFFSLSGDGCAAGGRQGMQERMRMVCWDIPVPQWAQG